MGLCFILDLTVCVYVSLEAGCRRYGRFGIQEFCSQKGQKPKLGCLCVFLVVQNLHVTEGWEQALRQTCGNAGMRLTHRPSECAAPRTHSHYSTFEAKLCAISVGLASLDLLLCVLMCFGSGSYWEITAHLWAASRMSREGGRRGFVSNAGLVLIWKERGVVCKMPWGFISSFSPGSSPTWSMRGL